MGPKITAKEFLKKYDSKKLFSESDLAGIVLRDQEELIVVGREDGPDTNKFKVIIKAGIRFFSILVKDDGRVYSPEQPIEVIRKEITHIVYIKKIDMKAISKTMKEILLRPEA